jgi:hypothetical protein
MGGIGHWRREQGALITEKGCAHPSSYTTFDNISPSRPNYAPMRA